MPRLIRITTVPMALKHLLAGQMRYMKENGFDVLMVSADGEEREEVIQNEGCGHIIIPMTRKITPLADLRSLWRLYRVFKKEKPDIVHSHTPKAGLLAMLAAKYARVPVRIHTIAGLRFMTAKGFSRRVMIAMEKLTCRAAQHVWPNSFSLNQYILEKKLCKQDKLSVIGNGSTNGINLERFNERSLKPEITENIKQKISYDSSLFYFLFVGRLVKDKGIEELIGAFTAVSKEYDTVRLVLVGNPEAELDPLSTGITDIIQTHPAIIPVGWDNRVEYYFNLCNLFVFPSHREGFPNVLLQAGALNCPVICSDIPGNIDVIEPGHTGLLYKVKNGDDLKEKLKFAFQNQEPVKQYAAALRKKIENNFDQRMVHQAVRNKYTELLSETR